MAGNAGERRRPAARAPPDWRSRGLPGVRWLAEEEEGVEAELLAVVAERGEVGNGGDGELWPGLGFGRRAERRGKREGKQNGASPLAAAGLYRRPGGGGAIQAAGAIDGSAGARQLWPCLPGEEDKGEFCENPPGLQGFPRKRKTGPPLMIFGVF